MARLSLPVILTLASETLLRDHFSLGSSSDLEEDEFAVVGVVPAARGRYVLGAREMKTLGFVVSWLHH